jgi:hypothetical protein
MQQLPAVPQGWINSGENGVDQLGENQVDQLGENKLDHLPENGVDQFGRKMTSVEGTRYSVPVGYVGRPLTVRLREKTVDFYDGAAYAATHTRVDGSKKPVIVPEHFEEVLKKKPRGRVMVYRDYLMTQDPSIEEYIAEVCRRWKGTFDCHILQMYELVQEFGAVDVGCACALASEHGAYGADYLSALLRRPRNVPVVRTLEVAGVPPQEDVDRTLSSYEAFVRGGAIHD